MKNKLLLLYIVSLFSVPVGAMEFDSDSDSDLDIEMVTEQSVTRSHTAVDQTAIRDLPSDNLVSLKSLYKLPRDMQKLIASYVPLSSKIFAQLCKPYTHTIFEDERVKEICKNLDEKVSASENQKSYLIGKIWAFYFSLRSAPIKHEAYRELMVGYIQHINKTKHTQLNVRHLHERGTIKELSFRADGKYLLTVDDKEGSHINVWTTNNGVPQACVRIPFAGMRYALDYSGKTIYISPLLVQGEQGVLVIGSATSQGISNYHKQKYVIMQHGTVIMPAYTMLTRLCFATLCVANDNRKNDALYFYRANFRNNIFHLIASINKYSISHVAFNKDGSRVAIAHQKSADNPNICISMYHIDMNDEAVKLASGMNNGDDTISCFALSNNNTMLAAAHDVIKIWNTGIGHCIGKISEGTIRALEFTPNDRILIGCAQHQGAPIFIYRIDPLEKLGEINMYDRWINCMKMNFDGTTLAVGLMHAQNNGLPEQDRVMLFDIKKLNKALLASKTGRALYDQKLKKQLLGLA